VATGSVGFNDTPFGAACGRRRFPHGVTGEVLEGIGCEPFVFQGFGGCDEVRVYFGFHYLIGRQLPGGPHSFLWSLPENSSFDEVRGTLAVGWNVDRLESVSVPSA